jgi:predicted YcjX-like family ATPase
MITLRLTLRRASRWKRAAGDHVVRLELLDYPGEWLMDLPLLEQSYEAWSAEVLADLAKPPRSDFAPPFLPPQAPPQSPARCRYWHP